MAAFARGVEVDKTAPSRNRVQKQVKSYADAPRVALPDPERELRITPTTYHLAAWMLGA